MGRNAKSADNVEQVHATQSIIGSYYLRIMRNLGATMTKFEYSRLGFLQLCAVIDPALPLKLSHASSGESKRLFFMHFQSSEFFRVWTCRNFSTLCSSWNLRNKYLAIFEGKVSTCGVMTLFLAIYISIRISFFWGFRFKIFIVYCSVTKNNRNMLFYLFWKYTFEDILIM